MLQIFEMHPSKSQAMDRFGSYIRHLSSSLEHAPMDQICELAEDLRQAWATGKRVYICGNGGSAANAMHIANDLIYGVSRKDGLGLRVHALPAETPILTCLANDESYAEIFSKQLAVQGEKGDLLLVLSGSGNSMNVVNAIEQARKLGMKTYAILGYSGGKCLALADVAIHFKVDDMQIAEDAQLVVGHMLMKWLCENPVRS